MDLKNLNTVILAQDSLLFSVGFNHCDISQYQKSLSEQLRFYHDKDGISDQSKFLKDLKNGLCKSPETRQVIRVLVKNSSQIFPLYKDNILYGAIHNGTHQFYENKDSTPGSAQFSNVWILENNQWKLQTSLSFDHQPKSEVTKETTVNTNDKIINNWLSLNKVKTLGIGIISNGKLTKIQTYGEIKPDNEAPYNTIFNVASLTKPITAMVALQLINKGLWTLDEPLSKYWIDPDIANDPNTKKITTQLVLTHQTGFPNWRWMTPNKKLQFQSNPGTHYQYSGEGFEYLRKALEQKFKKSLDLLAQELIFSPLEMKDTNYIWTNTIDESRYAIGYNTELKPYNIVKNTIPSAADDLHTTIEDYGKFLVNILKGGNLNDTLFNKLTTKYINTKPNKYFGLGFEIYDLGNDEIALSHSGSDEGSQSLFVLLPKTKQGLIIFTNSDAGQLLYEDLLKLFLGKNGQKIYTIETANNQNNKR